VIYFATTQRNERPIRKYLAGFGAPLRRRLRPVRYEWLLRARRVPDGLWCFADLELLSDAERARATEVWQQLEARGCRLLNHPTRSLRRYGLLRLLEQQGANRFRVRRLCESGEALRFPVFIRRENDHKGSRSPLIPDASALRAEAARLHAAGEDPRELLVTEFCDTADADGVYRKYAAFAIGDAILPRHVFFRRDWQVKRNQLTDGAFIEEELEYMQTNPHERRLREIFAAAQISYGRIDYALQGGEIQVWEINTNPVIAFPGRDPHGAFERLRRALWPPRTPPLRSGPRAPLHVAFAERLRVVWEQLEREARA
jgi:hypothetical protein